MYFLYNNVAIKRKPSSVILWIRVAKSHSLFLRGTYGFKYFKRIDRNQN